jgi:hypothetical protein
MLNLFKPKKSADTVVMNVIVVASMPLFMPRKSIKETLERSDRAGVDETVFRYEYSLLMCFGYLMGLASAEQSGIITQEQKQKLINLFLIRLEKVASIQDRPYSPLSKYDNFIEKLNERFDKYYPPLND